MSGINSLIDTLMHSVLGKRVDFPQDKALNEPVRPVSPPDVPLAVRSDSRLEPGQVGARRLLGHPLPQPAAPPAPADGSTPQSSIQANLSPAARAIADVLVRFPLPPSVLQTQAPLVAPGETPPPAEVAARLQANIGQSGLFYEHHLDRWYRGDMTLPQLAREPQMLWQHSLPGGLSRGTPVAGSQPAITTQAAPPLPGSQGAPAFADPVYTVTKVASTASSGPAASATVGSEESLRDGMESGELQRSRVSPAELPESLQAIVRHQLELLAVPMLRWEGDIWTGLFLSLLLQPPEQWRSDTGNGGQESGDESGDEREKPWCSELQLKVQGLGDLSVSIQLLGEQLDLRVAAHSETVLARLRDARAALQRGLGNCGFSAPVIHFVLLEAASVPEGAGGSAGE